MKTNANQTKIIQMFDNIAPTYDKVNRIISMGTDISWRKKACDIAFEKLQNKDVKLIVDVACGTGDMIGFWQKRAEKKKVKVKRIIGVDPSSNMLRNAKKKFPNVDFIKSAATDLPFPNECAEILSISYGIRNVVERQNAFNEFARVVKIGGFVVMLEFTKDEGKGFIYNAKRFYLNKILPFIGGFISKNYEAYKYLPDSIDGFLTHSMLQDELSNAGFKTIYIKSFSMNVSTLLIAQKC